MKINIISLPELTNTITIEENDLKYINKLFSYLESHEILRIHKEYYHDDFTIKIFTDHGEYRLIFSGSLLGCCDDFIIRNYWTNITRFHIHSTKLKSLMLDLSKYDTEIYIVDLRATRID